MRQLIDEQIIFKAKKQAGFRIHFIIFLITLPCNWLIWWFTGKGYMWPIWPTLGWGVGLLFHYVGIYHSDKFFSVAKQMKKLNPQE
jgi:hypothetical protein